MMHFTRGYSFRFSALSLFIIMALLSRSPCVCEEAITSEEDPLYCYQCNSSKEPDCKLLVNATVHYKPCPSQQDFKPFCRKIVQKIFARDGLEVVIRRCGWIRHPTQDCYTGRNIDRSQKVCQCFSPGCNTAHSTTAALTLLICAAAVTAANLSSLS